MTTLKTWGRSRAVRLDEAYYPPGQPVHVVISTHRPMALFHPSVLANSVFEPVKADPRSLAACLMPDHLHWLVLIQGQLNRQVQRFKQISTHRAREAGHRGPLWQRSFFDHVLRKEETVETVARYILDNPLRAGLVGSEGDYPYLHLNWEA